MLFAVGWAVVRSSREPFATLNFDSMGAEEWSQAFNVIDDACDRADLELFDRFEAFMAECDDGMLSWSFQRALNNVRGVLTFASSRNHRGKSPTSLRIMEWLAVNGTGSYGLLYLHDDEDDGVSKRYGRGGVDRTNEFRVWRLASGQLMEFDDPFLSPIVPLINPSDFA
ncbi:Imm7 family immunity protein [Lacipirellula parvula]|uniref:Uncharacterized protein n=1 Tax=Lacipirellula parvula TaxID=2650471 RepID=A0A5K7XLE1_9BACT|nr:Imm7 family immunity protein [Lacipirellula parvula]BBO36121.1 hypothetical protein PLANPX_5733 [Lacipirellula parvula]